MNQEFKEGDVVKLKSGGEEMTVSGVEGEIVHVTWFADGKLQSSTVSNTVITKKPDMPNPRGGSF